MKFVLCFFVFGIITVAIILIMLASGCTDVNDKKGIWKRVPGHIKGRVLLAPCLLFGFALWSIGMDRKYAIWVTLCSAFLLAGVLWFLSYKDGVKRIKKLEDKLKKELDEELACKPKAKQN